MEEILSSKGVKPSLSPNLKVLAEVEARGLKKLLFIGVGCAVQALRAVEPHLGRGADHAASDTTHCAAACRVTHNILHQCSPRHPV